jgi:hypothetical protein
MSFKKTPATFRDSPSTVRHSLDGAWTQAELGDVFDIATLCAIGELDPTGAKGVVREVLVMFRDVLEPALGSIEEGMRDPSGSRRLLSSAQKLCATAGRIGAQRLAAACDAVERHLTSRPARAVHIDAELRSLVEAQIAEIVRVQRRLRILLG